MAHLKGVKLRGRIEPRFAGSGQGHCQVVEHHQTTSKKAINYMRGLLRQAGVSDIADG
jgi:hypothetical protein